MLKILIRRSNYSDSIGIYAEVRLLGSRELTDYFDSLYLSLTSTSEFAINPTYSMDNFKNLVPTVYYFCLGYILPNERKNRMKLLTKKQVNSFLQTAEVTGRVWCRRKIDSWKVNYAIEEVIVSMNPSDIDKRSLPSLSPILRFIINLLHNGESTITGT